MEVDPLCRFRLRRGGRARGHAAGESSMTARRLMRVAAGGAIVAVGAALVAGHFRWRAETRALRERLAEARRPVVPDRVDFGELDGLPAPVQRYFRTVLADGQPMIAAVDLRHSG